MDQRNRLASESGPEPSTNGERARGGRPVPTEAPAPGAPEGTRRAPERRESEGEAPAPTERVFVVVPVFNNRKTVRRVVRGALSHGLPVIVVDDGSSDGSASEVSDLPVELLTSARNRGKGAALLHAARRVLERGGTHMISLDADGQLDPDDLPRFAETIRNHPRAIVYGERRFVRGDAPGSAIFGRAFSNFWVRATTGQRIRDSQCGYRAYPVGDLLRLGLRGTGYEMEIEALVRAAWAGIPIVGIPVAVTYAPREGRVSSFRPIRDNFRISRTYARLFLRATILFPVQARPPAGGDTAIKPLSPFHPVRLIRAMLAERSSPAELGAAAALGLLLATLPLIGFHTMAVVLAATILRLNRLMAFSVSHLCAPPFVPAICLMTGYYLRNGRWLSEFNARVLVHQIDQRFLDYLVGTLVVAPVLALAGGAAAWGLASVIQRTPAKAPRMKRPGAPSRPGVYGSRWGIGFFRIVLSLGGLRPAYLSLWFVVPYYLVFRPEARRAMQPYLAHRFPDHGPLRRFIDSARLLMAFSRTLVEQGAAMVLGKEYFDVTVEDRTGLVRLLSGERATVLLMAHVGPWAAILPYLDLAPKPVHVMLAGGYEGPALIPFGEPRESGKLRIIDPGAPLGGVVAATVALRKGEIVAVMGDRPWGGRTVEAEFFGEPARVLRTPYKLAFATDARLVLLLARRSGYRKYRIQHWDLSQGPDQAARSEDEIARDQARAYLSHIEEFLRREPYLWSNFFDFWRPDPSPAATDRAATERATTVKQEGRVAHRGATT